MNIIKAIVAIILTIVLIGVAGAVLATTGIKSQPGYADWTLPRWSLSDTRVVINVGPMGLKPVRWLIEKVVLNADEEDLEPSELALLAMLQNVHGFQLRVYEVGGDHQKFDRAIDASVVSLKKDAWQTVVSVREDDERVVVMQAQNAGIISGVTVMVSQPNESVFINLVGQFNPAEIAAYAEALRGVEHGFEPNKGSAVT